MKAGGTCTISGCEAERLLGTSVSRMAQHIVTDRRSFKLPARMPQDCLNPNVPTTYLQHLNLYAFRNPTSFFGKCNHLTATLARRTVIITSSIAGVRPDANNANNTPSNSKEPLRPGAQQPEKSIAQGRAPELVQNSASPKVSAAVSGSKATQRRPT